LTTKEYNLATPNPESSNPVAANAALSIEPNVYWASTAGSNAASPPVRVLGAVKAASVSGGGISTREEFRSSVTGNATRWKKRRMKP
jgi:hypothetical protein